MVLLDDLSPHISFEEVMALASAFRGMQYSRDQKNLDLSKETFLAILETVRERMLKDLAVVKR